MLTRRVEGSNMALYFFPAVLIPFYTARHYCLYLLHPPVLFRIFFIFANVFSKVVTMRLFYFQ